MDGRRRPERWTCPTTKKICCSAKSLRCGFSKNFAFSCFFFFLLLSYSLAAFLAGDSCGRQVDVQQQSDPQACTEYVNEVYAYLHDSQHRYMVGDYLGLQADITSNMTGILMDWLVEVAEEYHLTNQTLHLAKLYIDRFLNLIKVSRSKLQLVGVSGMLIASKFEEIFPPGVDDFVYISDNTFTRQQVIEMETLMLNSLQFDLTNPTSLGFLERYARITGSDAVVTTLAKFLSELTLLDYGMVSFLPSHVALSCLVLANATHDIQPALPRLLQGFVAPVERERLQECISAVHKLWLNSGRTKLQAVRVKYERTRHHKVSCTVPPPIPPLV